MGYQAYVHTPSVSQAASTCVCGQRREKEGEKEKLISLYHGTLSVSNVPCEREQERYFSMSYV